MDNPSKCGSTKRHDSVADDCASTLAAIRPVHPPVGGENPIRVGASLRIGHRRVRQRAGGRIGDEVYRPGEMPPQHPSRVARQDARRQRRDHEEVDRGYIINMIVQAPHVANQLSHLLIDLRTTTPGPALPAPVSAEASTVPSHDTYPIPHRRPLLLNGEKASDLAADGGFATHRDQSERRTGDPPPYRGQNQGIKSVPKTQNMTLSGAPTRAKSTNRYWPGP